MKLNLNVFCQCALCAFGISIAYEAGQSLHLEHSPLETHKAMFTNITSGSMSIPDTTIEERSYEIVRPQPTHIVEVTSLSS
jgi:hypothetical protein